MQKKKMRDFSGVIFYPLKPPLGANFTTEQICCKSMVHHEPWDISRFICSLPAVCRSCAFSYMPSLSGTHMLNANGKLADSVVWQREPPCAPVFDFGSQGRVNIPIARFKMDLKAFLRDFQIPKFSLQNTG